MNCVLSVDNDCTFVVLWFSFDDDDGTVEDIIYAPQTKEDQPRKSRVLGPG